MTTYSATWENHYFIFYKVNSNRTLTSVSEPKPIVLCTNKYGQDFYGVRAGRYGMYVPQEAERWGVFKYENDIWTPQFGAPVPKPSERNIIQIDKGRFVIIRRSTTNINFSISLSSKKVKAQS